MSTTNQPATAQVAAQPAVQPKQMTAAEFQQQASKIPMAIAKLLRHHKELKQRKGIFQSRQSDFFRFKRFMRALNSPEYQKKSANQPFLYPPLNQRLANGETKDISKELFILLIKSQLVLPVIKLHTHELKARGLKPNKDMPHLILSTKATLSPDEYYVWNYNPKSLWDYLTVIAVVLAILAFVCYPLWPSSMRRVTYYISLSSLLFMAVFFGIAIVRFIVYLISLLFVKKDPNAREDAGRGFWLFPNLFEDCGVLDSFKPLYGFGNVECYSYIKKQKKLKKRQQLREKKRLEKEEEKERELEKHKPKIEEVEDDREVEEKKEKLEEGVVATDEKSLEEGPEKPEENKTGKNNNSKKSHKKKHHK